MLVCSCNSVVESVLTQDRSVVRFHPGSARGANFAREPTGSLGHRVLKGRLTAGRQILILSDVGSNPAPSANSCLFPVRLMVGLLFLGQSMLVRFHTWGANSHGESVGRIRSPTSGRENTHTANAFEVLR